MRYEIRAIELYVRETPPGRMAFALGKTIGTNAAQRREISPLGHVRLILRDERGRETFGCSADRLSVRWFDKRPDRDESLKLRELVALIHAARDIYLEQPRFTTPFEKWHDCHPLIMQEGRRHGQEDLTSSFASSLIERAVLDAVCRLEGRSIFEMVKQDGLGLDPAAIHPELQGIDLPAILPDRPRTRFFIRHTVGGSDPLTAADQPENERVNDGLPETLQEYIRRDGVRFFKVKVSGKVDHDLERLSRIWDVVLEADQPAITLDANEAFTDLRMLDEFVRRLEDEQLGLFQHILYVEQPLPRALTFDPQTRTAIERISERKPLIIDEADGTLDAFKRAHAIGYRGTSHKNCKGFFKSLLNYGLVHLYSRGGEAALLSGEDLQTLPIVPLQQDFASLGVLGLEHCERNGHHYNYGLSMLSDRDKASAVRHHPDLYERRGDEWFLRIRNGAVECASLQHPGFGVRDEPDWASMMDMRAWVRERHSA